jgi:hypothetical protein
VAFTKASRISTTFKETVLFFHLLSQLGLSRRRWDESEKGKLCSVTGNEVPEAE